MQDLSAALTTALDHHRAGRFEQAEAGYRHVLAVAPRQPNALYLYGSLLVARGELGAGELILMRAAVLRPDDADIPLVLGNTRQRLGDGAGARLLWAEALEICPGHEGACCNLARALCGAMDWRGAVETCRNALAHRPESAAMWLALAAALLMGRAMSAALTAAEAALDLDDTLAEAWLIRGTVFTHLGEFEPALAALRRSLELDPGSARAALNLGNALIDLDRMEEAELWLGRAIARDPTLPEAHTSLGFLRCSQLDLRGAVACHREALRLRPDFAEAHGNLSAALLLGGDLPDGFAEYEWRKRNPAVEACYWASTRPEWAGESLAGRRILVFCEQGLGDTIMCARYLPLLAALGAAIIVVCSAPLIPLLRQLPGVVAWVRRGEARSGQFVAPGETVPDYDIWIDQMSFPRVFGTELGSIPGREGYLRADPDLVAAWHGRLPAGRKVGLAWAGNPEHHNDRRRSMGMGELMPLLGLGGIGLVSLQRDAACAGVTDVSAGLTDFAQTAAVIACLDLVIAVDTAVAHLAGALGKPVWLMLPYAPEWRWLLGGAVSPWYGRMRLFRQRKAGVWRDVVAEIVAALSGSIDSSSR